MVRVEQEEEKEGVRGCSCNGKYSHQPGLVPMLCGRTCKGVGTSGRHRQSPFLLFFLGWNGNVNDWGRDRNRRWSGRAGFVGRRVDIEGVEV